MLLADKAPLADLQQRLDPLTAPGRTFRASARELLAQVGLALKVGIVAAVFLVGQFVEGHLLTPRLVGGAVGLHPVWTIFALLAGGAIAGFTIYLGLPVGRLRGHRSVSTPRRAIQRRNAFDQTA